ncbi:hypothetical protein ACKI1S_47530, partial [Streptomyces galilaeus]
MQQYAEESVAKHIPNMQKLLDMQDNIKKGTVWKGYENILESAIKQSDRWRNLKKEGLSDEETKKTFYQKIPMRVFAWNKNRH